MNPADRTRAIIDRLGGEAGVRQALGPGHARRRVGMWLSRGCIPPRAWPLLIQVARDLDVPLTWDELATTIEIRGEPSRAA